MEFFLGFATAGTIWFGIDWLRTKTKTDGVLFLVMFVSLCLLIFEWINQ